MEQFNLEEFLKDKNRKVVTRDGRLVRIICTDRKARSGNIVGLVGEDESFIYVWQNDGTHAVSGIDVNDLFFADEEDGSRTIEIPLGAKDSEFIRDEYCIPEGCEARIEGNKVIIEKVQKEEQMTEFEKELERMMVSFSNGNLGSDVRKEMPKQKLHDCANRLLELARKEIAEKLSDDNFMIDLALSKGKWDALKDLPKWKRVPKTWKFEDNVKVVFSEDYKYYIDKKELFNKLPKE